MKRRLVAVAALVFVATSGAAFAQDPQSLYLLLREPAVLTPPRLGGSPGSRQSRVTKK